MYAGIPAGRDGDFASPAGAPPGYRERRLEILQVHLRQWTISQEEYEQHLREMGLDGE